MRWTGLILFVGTAAAMTAGAGERDARGVEFFEKSVRPVLAERCYSCHSEQARAAKKLKAGLLLDSRRGVLKGGESGGVLGKVEESSLVKAVRYADADLKMPPKGRLSDAEVRALEQWVGMGAPMPSDLAGDGVAEATLPSVGGRAFWSFQRPKEVAPPAVRDAAWCANDIDRFVLAKLEEKGLKPAPQADRRTLIRRATFDLTGLPPTPAEVEAFLADGSAGAFGRVVDRLLASPRYGERWGRHWLDVARYADSNGLDENVAHGNAWRYRDWVIGAFNADLPYDRFVSEQIAGDLLDERPAQSAVVATGFLALGPKVLAEVDERKMEMDIIDEQVDTVGRAVLGLTLGCARCHDHKFDPISTADYYGLAGVFKSTRTMESFTKIAKWWENPVPTAAELEKKGAHEKRVAEMKGEIAARVAVGGVLPVKLDEGKSGLKKLRADLAALEKSPPEVSSAMGVAEGKAVDVAVHVRGSHLTLGAVVPRRFPVVLAGERQAAIDKAHSGRLELARFLTARENPLTARVMVNRVWRWHFGRGIVGTPDNFGKLGERPTHPELLDWLALQFMESGWSVKALHRRIMSSRTYQMGGAFDERAARVDPDDRLHWRAEPRRLEAEAIRDEILAVSGRLDLTAGGPAITHVKNREFLFDHTSKDGTRYDSPRRSVYLPVVRNHLYDFFELYDFPDSAVAQGDRATTTVASQALWMMNSPIVWDAAGRLADEVSAGDVRGVYPKLFGREAREDEVRRFEAFVGAAQGEARGRAVRAYLQALLASNEFVYVK